MCLIGTVGLVVSGMVPAADFASAGLRWTLADLFGLVVVGPFVMSLIRHRQRGGHPGDLPYPGKFEHALLFTAMLVSLGGQWLLSQAAPNNALVLSFLPAAVLMWSALRMSPLVTTAMTLCVGLVVAAFANFGIGGFVVPRSPGRYRSAADFPVYPRGIPAHGGRRPSRVALAAAEILHRASTDRLTGLPNRAAFETDAAIAIDSPAQLPLALAYIDVDQFKLVNDTLGHAMWAISSCVGWVQSVLAQHACDHRMTCWRGWVATNLPCCCGNCDAGGPPISWGHVEALLAIEQLPARSWTAQSAERQRPALV